MVEQEVKVYNHLTERKYEERVSTWNSKAKSQSTEYITMDTFQRGGKVMVFDEDGKKRKVKMPQASDDELMSREYRPVTKLSRMMQDKRVAFLKAGGNTLNDQRAMLQASYPRGYQRYVRSVYVTTAVTKSECNWMLPYNGPGIGLSVEQVEGIVVDDIAQVRVVENSTSAEPSRGSDPYVLGLDDGQWICFGCSFINRATNKVCGGKGPMGCKAPKKGWEGLDNPSQPYPGSRPKRMIRWNQIKEYHEYIQRECKIEETELTVTLPSGMKLTMRKQQKHEVEARASVTVSEAQLDANSEAASTKLPSKPTEATDKEWQARLAKIQEPKFNYREKTYEWCYCDLDEFCMTLQDKDLDDRPSSRRQRALTDSGSVTPKSPIQEGCRTPESVTDRIQLEWEATDAITEAVLLKAQAEIAKMLSEVQKRKPPRIPSNPPKGEWKTFQDAALDFEEEPLSLEDGNRPQQTVNRLLPASQRAAEFDKPGTSVRTVPGSEVVSKTRRGVCVTGTQLSSMA